MNAPTQEEVDREFEALSLEYRGRLTRQDFLLALMHAKLDAMKVWLVKERFPVPNDAARAIYNENEKVRNDLLRHYLNFLSRDHKPVA